MSEQNGGGETGAFLAGFILGGLVGAAVAMIMAPSSGPETRKQLVDKGIELRGLAETRMQEARVQAGEASGEVRSRAEQAAGDALRHAAELQERSRVILEEQKTRLTSTLQDNHTDAAETGDTPSVAPNGETPNA